jgi:hypothetical protein
MGSRGGSGWLGGIGAFFFMDPAVRLNEEYSPGPGKGQWADSIDVARAGGAAVQAADRKSGGPVARGKGGRGLTERGRPFDGRGYYASTGQDEAHYDLGQATPLPCFRCRAPSLGQSPIATDQPETRVKARPGLLGPSCKTQN